MYEVLWHFVHSFTSYSRLSGATFAFLLYHHDYALSQTSLKAMSKLDQLRFELVAQSPYSPDLALSDYYLFPNFKRWLQGKRFTSNEKVIAKTEAYFEDLNVSYYRKGIEILENRYTKCIALEGNCWGINITLPKKRLFSLKIPGFFSPCSACIDSALVLLWYGASAEPSVLSNCIVRNVSTIFFELVKFKISTHI